MTRSAPNDLYFDVLSPACKQGAEQAAGYNETVMTLFESLRHQQVQRRLQVARAEADCALQALRERGVVVHIIGSLDSGHFKLHSDVDFLIDDATNLTYGEIYGLITDHVRSAPVDIVFAAQQSEQSLALLRGGTRTTRVA